MLAISKQTFVYTAFSGLLYLMHYFLKKSNPLFDFVIKYSRGAGKCTPAAALILPLTMPAEFISSAFESEGVRQCISKNINI